MKKIMALAALPLFAVSACDSANHSPPAPSSKATTAATGSSRTTSGTTSASATTNTTSSTPPTRSAAPSTSGTPTATARPKMEGEEGGGASASNGGLIENGSDHLLSPAEKAKGKVFARKALQKFPGTFDAQPYNFIYGEGNAICTYRDMGLSQTQAEAAIANVPQPTRDQFYAFSVSELCPKYAGQ